VCAANVCALGVRLGIGSMASSIATQGPKKSPTVWRQRSKRSSAVESVACIALKPFSLPHCRSAITSPSVGRIALEGSKEPLRLHHTCCQEGLFVGRIALEYEVLRRLCLAGTLFAMFDDHKRHRLGGQFLADNLLNAAESATR
jgi:hypothetical protein